MTLTRRGRALRDITVATLITIPLAFAASLGSDADAAPAPSWQPISTAIEYARDAQRPEPWKCKDRAAVILYKAGFTGQRHAMAWAITYRESKHQNLGSDSPWFSGAYGMWQIQESAHSGKPWYSRSAMMDPLKQSKIVYRHMSNKGRNWQPWGLTRHGQLDPTQYQSWGPDLWEAWIMAPFREGLSLYPCKTTPPK